LRALLAPETITPGVLYLVSESAPSRVILGAGAGGFAITQITETDAVYFDAADRTPERVEAKFSEIASSVGRPMSAAIEQTRKFLRKAANAQGVQLAEP